MNFYVLRGFVVAAEIYSFLVGNGLAHSACWFTACGIALYAERSRPFPTNKNYTACGIHGPLPVKVRFGVGATLRGRPLLLIGKFPTIVQ